MRADVCVCACARCERDLWRGKTTVCGVDHNSKRTRQYLLYLQVYIFLVVCIVHCAGVVASIYKMGGDAHHLRALLSPSLSLSPSC